MGVRSGRWRYPARIQRTGTTRCARHLIKYTYKEMQIELTVKDFLISQLWNSYCWKEARKSDTCHLCYHRQRSAKKPDKRKRSEMLRCGSKLGSPNFGLLFYSSLWHNLLVFRWFLPQHRLKHYADLDKHAVLILPKEMEAKNSSLDTNTKNDDEKVNYCVTFSMHAQLCLLLRDRWMNLWRRNTLLTSSFN